MNDAEYEMQRARTQRYVDKWMPAGFGWWKIDIKWDRGDHSICDTSEQGGSCSVRWEYRHAFITFRLANIVGMDEETLEELVVHELAHLIVSPIQDYSSDNARQMTEFTVTTLARALLWTAKHVHEQEAAEEPKIDE